MLGRLAIGYTDVDGWGRNTFTGEDVNGLSLVEHANGTVTEYQYDQLNRLTLLRTWDATGQLIQRQQFHLGAAGHREMVVEYPERVVEYSYDALYRLTAEQVTDPNGDRTTTYSFDATGNRLSRVVSCDPACTGEVEAGTTTYVYDANDRLLEETGPLRATACANVASDGAVEDRDLVAGELQAGGLPSFKYAVTRNSAVADHDRAPDPDDAGSQAVQSSLSDVARVGIRLDVKHRLAQAAGAGIVSMGDNECGGPGRVVLMTADRPRNG